MIHLVWGLFNIAFFVFFLVLCYKAIRLIKDKLGLFAAIILVFVLLTIIGYSNNKYFRTNSNEVKKWSFVTEDSLQRNSSFSLHIDLEKTAVSKLELVALVGKNQKGQLNIPISAYSLLTGFISGIEWEPESISVIRTVDNSKFKYSVTGFVNWKLLNATIYAQSKEFKGTGSY